MSQRNKVLTILLAIEAHEENSTTPIHFSQITCQRSSTVTSKAILSRECILVQNHAEHLNLLCTQVLDYHENYFFSSRVLFQDEHDTISKPPKRGGIHASPQRGSHDKYVVKLLP